ncbi:hypothetical protein [Neobacillus sp. 204]|uniref:hypothetical protein n=1 Tax=Neobacillus sp. 204 TaxID=3383351 RepID=UPI00397E1AEA
MNDVLQLTGAFAQYPKLSMSRKYAVFYSLLAYSRFFIFKKHTAKTAFFNCQIQMVIRTFIFGAILIFPIAFVEYI